MDSIPGSNAGNPKIPGIKKKFSILLTVILAILVLNQGYIFYKYQKQITSITTLSEQINDEVISLFNSNYDFLILQEELEILASENILLKTKVAQAGRGGLFMKFSPNESIMVEIAQREDFLERMLDCAGQLMSVMQRSNQLDKEITLLVQSQTATYQTAFDSLKKYQEENDVYISEVLALVLPKEFRDYQQRFADALTERGMYLSSINEYFYSTMQASINTDLAIDTYEEAAYYWEVQMAVDLATEAEMYEQQAALQYEEAQKHLKNYQRLLGKFSQGTFI